ncbi:hypothetical protein CC80DRAFT_102262 [Byssothecium circinans]|uniref:BRCT domain-containing protein n=1 Tax=Byssothecium circinans TaxID=147558 RepID=A0A6A5UF92_9PLEO|nr:hypothetical protein CC80DRAFT_102262 [Byssothecium circinans]
MAPKTDTVSISVRSDALEGDRVIITGEIGGQSRKSAEQILINAGATIEKSLNKKVTLVVLGENAGQAKLDKIEKLGCETKEWDDLIEEIKGDGGAAADADEPADEDEEEEEAEPEVEKVRNLPDHAVLCPKSRNTFLNLSLRKYQKTCGLVLKASWTWIN